MEPIELDHRRVFSCSFALLDPAACRKPLLAAWDEAFTQHTLVPDGFAPQAGKLPRLVVLRDLTDKQRNTLLDLLLGHTADAPACAALLETEAGSERMVRHGLRLLAPHFPGNRRGIFRFYDPTVFEHLGWMLRPHELAALFGPITAWLLPMRGRWHVQTPPHLPGATPVSFQLSSATWQRVQRIAAIHATLELAPTWQAAPAAWGPKADELLARAEQHQLADRDDAIAFASHGLRWHADLDTHPRMASLLHDCIGHPTRYRRRTGSWSDADWQAIAADLVRGTSQAVAPAHLTSHGTCP